MILKRLSDYHLFLLAFFIVAGFIFVFSYRIAPKVSQEVEIFVLTGEVSRPETVTPPSDTIIEDPKPQFEWKPALGFNVDKNLLQLSTAHSFLRDLLEYEAQSSKFKIPINLNPGVYFWRVRAVNSAGEKSPWSFKSCFVLGPMQKAFPSPELASPVYERIKFVENTLLSINFRWEPSYYDPYCFVFPSKYLIEIGQDAYFSTILYNTTVTTNKLALEDASILLNDMLNGVASTPFFWKVKPVDAWGKEGEWSKVENFYLVNAEISKL